MIMVFNLIAVFIFCFMSKDHSIHVAILSYCYNLYYFRCFKFGIVIKDSAVCLKHIFNDLEFKGAF